MAAIVCAALSASPDQGSAVSRAVAWETDAQNDEISVLPSPAYGCTACRVSL